MVCVRPGSAWPAWASRVKWTLTVMCAWDRSWMRAIGPAVSGLRAERTSRLPARGRPVPVRGARDRRSPCRLHQQGRAAIRRRAGSRLTASWLGQGALDLLRSPCSAVLLSDPLRQLGGASVHGGVIEGGADRRRKTRRGELVRRQRLRASAGAVHSRAPEVLVALERADNGRTCREQAGRGRPRPSVMDDGGNTGNNQRCGALSMTSTSESSRTPLSPPHPLAITARTPARRTAPRTAAPTRAGSGPTLLPKPT